MRYMIAVAVLLVGCASPAERAAQQRQQEMQRQQAVANYWRSLNAQCANIGYAQNTDAHRGCVMQLHQIEEQRRAAIGAAIIGSGALNRPVQQQPQPYQMPVPRQTNCYTDRLGYTTCTTR